MSYHVDLDPYMNRDRDERVLREMVTCRLELQNRALSKRWQIAQFCKGGPVILVVAPAGPCT